MTQGDTPRRPAARGNALDGLRVRPVEPPDFPHMTRLSRTVIETMESYDRKTRDFIAGLYRPPSLEEMLQRILGLRVAELPGGLVGMGGLRLQKTDGNDPGRATGNVFGMYVEPELQGQGIGSALLEDLEDLARRERLRVLIANSSSEGRAFYASRGFVELRPFQRHLGDVSIPFLEMRKELSP